MLKCCPLTSSDGEGPSCASQSIRKARKDHTCYECSTTIAKGMRYEYVSGIWDGRANSYKTCLSCVEIRNHFGCDGWIYGRLWEDLAENFFPEMKAGGPCMEGLSVEAKARLFEVCLAWREKHPRRKAGWSSTGGTNAL